MWDQRIHQRLLLLMHRRSQSGKRNWYMSAAPKAAKFPYDMTTQGNDMVCKWCCVVVKRKEKLCAISCLKSEKHKRRGNMLPFF